MRLLVVAVAARAIAESLSRAGHEVVAVDRFGDRDLRTLVRRWYRLQLPPNGIHLIRLAEHAGCAGVLWGAPLENWPDVLEAMDRAGLNQGCTARAVATLRDWNEIGPRLIRAGVTVPAWSYSVPRREPIRWLLKPRRGGGGIGIQAWEGNVPRNAEHYYWQERLDGQPASLLYFVRRGRWQLLWFGCQLLCCVAGAPFVFAGAAGPLVPDVEEQQDIRRIGAVLSAVEGCRGLVGVDVVRWRGRLWPVEVNPRWSATTELAEAFWRQRLTLPGEVPVGGERA